MVGKSREMVSDGIDMVVELRHDGGYVMAKDACQQYLVRYYSPVCLLVRNDFQSAALFLFLDPRQSVRPIKLRNVVLTKCCSVAPTFQLFRKLPLWL